MSGLLFHVTGTPAPQGSKSAFRNKYTGKIQQVESSKKVTPWRQDVRAAATQAREAIRHTTYDGPVAVHITFAFRRPTSHYGTGRNAHALKPSAPHSPASRATYDIDKLARSTLDALTQAGVFLDDAQVSELNACKAYVEGDELPGATILVQPVTPHRDMAETPSVQGALL